VRATSESDSGGFLREIEVRLQVAPGKIVALFGARVTAAERPRLVVHLSIDQDGRLLPRRGLEPA